MQPYRHGTLVVVLDCADLSRAGAFWCDVLGYQQPYTKSGKYWNLISSEPNGVELLLQCVSEVKTQKNRVHLDLRTRDLDVEVARVIAAGAHQLTETVLDENEWRWQVFADPDGNEFCILQPPDDFPWPPN